MFSTFVLVWRHVTFRRPLANKFQRLRGVDWQSYTELIFIPNLFTAAADDRIWL